MKRSSKINYLFIFLPLLLLSCQNKVGDNKKDYGDWAYFGVYGKLTGIDPIGKIASVSAMLTDIIFNGLLDLDQNGEIIPDLAKKWEWSQDNKSVYFYLKDNAKFHDGTPLKADDVKYSFELILKQSSFGASRYTLDMIDGVKVIDPKTIAVNFKEKFRFFPFDNKIYILPRDSYGNIGQREKFIWNPIGTGPFKVKKISESEAVLESNLDYFKGRPFLDGVEVKSYQSQDEVWSRLLMEEIDFCLPLSPTQVDYLKNNSSFKMNSYLDPYFYILVFNQKNHLFQSKKVRIALNLAISRSEIVDRILNNNGRLCSGTVYPGSWSCNQQIEPYPYDPQTALRLLREEGWGIRNNGGVLSKDGKPFVFNILIIKGDELDNKLALMIEKDLSEIGIKIKSKTVNVGDIDKFLFAKNFDAAILNLYSGIHPGSWNYQFWHSSQIRNGLNVFSYQNSEVDKDLELALQAGNKKEEKEYYFRFQKEIFDDPPGVFLFWREEITPIHKRFQGVNVGPTKFFASISEWWVPKNEQKYKNAPN